jgi:Sap, sulfolipid-1-addressing protein
MLVLSLVLIGLAITLEPIPLTAFILILASAGGVRKGAAFIFGWLVSLAIVIAVTVLITGNNPPRPSWPRSRSSWPSAPRYWWSRSGTTGSGASRNRRKSPPGGRRTSTT